MDKNLRDATPIPAGDFARFLNQTLQGREADVPCGECNACCRASYFIHVTPTDHEARKVIPQPLLFAAPGQPKGTALMGFNAKGCCPMFVEDRCSIYAKRPKTCRDYDCRVFAAAGIDAGGIEKNDVNRRVARWKFEYATDQDRQRHQATRDAATFLGAHRQLFRDPDLPSNPTEIALLAIRIHKLFIDQQGSTDPQLMAGKIRPLLTGAS